VVQQCCAVVAAMRQQPRLLLLCVDVARSCAVRVVVLAPAVVQPHGSRCPPSLLKYTVEATYPSSAPDSVVSVTAVTAVSRKRDGSKAELMDYGMPAKRKGGAAGTSVLDLDTAGLYRPRTKVGSMSHSLVLYLSICCAGPAGLYRPRTKVGS
jgi:hypothetical protein